MLVSMADGPWAARHRPRSTSHEVLFMRHEPWANNQPRATSREPWAELWAMHLEPWTMNEPWAMTHDTCTNNYIINGCIEEVIYPTLLEANQDVLICYLGCFWEPHKPHKSDCKHEAYNSRKNVFSMIVVQARLRQTLSADESFPGQSNGFASDLR